MSKGYIGSPASILRDGDLGQVVRAGLQVLFRARKDMRSGPVGLDEQWPLLPTRGPRRVQKHDASSGSR